MGHDLYLEVQFCMFKCLSLNILMIVFHESSPLSSIHVICVSGIDLLLSASGSTAQPLLHLSANVRLLAAVYNLIESSLADCKYI
jgi:hypothetical protein